MTILYILGALIVTFIAFRKLTNHEDYDQQNSKVGTFILLLFFWPLIAIMIIILEIINRLRR